MTSYIDPANKLLGHMDRLDALKNGKQPAPINVELDLSNRCSLGCAFCHQAFTHTRGPLANTGRVANRVAGGDLMDTDLCLSIIDQLASYGIRSLTLSGGGEPTLHPDFDRIVEHAGSRLPLGIYTHGGHINEERAAVMKRHMDWVYVSLDAANREYYKQYKRVDRFAAACSGIENLARAEGRATIGVGYLVNPDNWRDVHEAAELADELGADYIQFRPTILFDQDDPSRLDEDTRWMDDALEELLAVKEECGDFVEFDADRFVMYRTWGGHPYSVCWWSGLQTIVTPNGSVFACANRREHADALLGNLAEEPFASIWARHRPHVVGESCRVMCRGHISNVALDEIMKPREHAAFV